MQLRTTMKCADKGLRIAALSAALVLALPAGLALADPAQPGVPNPASPNPASPNPASPPAAAAPADAGAADAQSGRLPGKSETSPGEARAQLLDELYSQLAKATDAAAAAPIVKSIEALWLHSGSPTANLLLDRAIQAVENQRVDLGLRFLDAVTELHPEWAEGFNRRAYLYVMRRDLNRAMGDLRRVLALDPGNFRALEGLLQILRDMGQAKAALDVARQLVQQHPHSPGAREALQELEREVDGQGI